VVPGWTIHWQRTDAFYGNVQVKAIIQGGKITGPYNGWIIRVTAALAEINSQATPWLTQEAIQGANAQVGFYLWRDANQSGVRSVAAIRHQTRQELNRAGNHL